MINFAIIIIFLEKRSSWINTHLQSPHSRNRGTNRDCKCCRNFDHSNHYRKSPRKSTLLAANPIVT